MTTAKTLATCAFLATVLPAALHAQGQVDIYMDTHPDVCLSENTGLFESAFLARDCEVMSGIVGTVTGQADHGRLSVRTRVGGATLTSNRTPRVTGNATWGDGIEWTTPGVATVQIVARAWGETAAARTYQGPMDYSGAYGQGAFILYGWGLTASSYWSNFFEGVGPGSAIPGTATAPMHGTSWDEIASVTMDVHDRTFATFMMSLQMENWMFTGNDFEGVGGISGHSSGDLRADITAIAFRDADGNLMTNVDYSFQRGGQVGSGPTDGTVTPEPVTMVLVGSGLVATAGARRRRRAVDKE